MGVLKLLPEHIFLKVSVAQTLRHWDSTEKYGEEMQMFSSEKEERPSPEREERAKAWFQKARLMATLGIQKRMLGKVVPGGR